MDKLQKKTRRLSKAARDLNVGVNNLGEFLQKKGITIEVSPNTKIDDEQYQLLVAEFSKDKKLKQEAIEFLEDKQQKVDSRETVSIPGFDKKKDEKSKKEETPGIKVIGSIDLEKSSGITKTTEQKAVKKESEEKKDSKTEVAPVSEEKKEIEVKSVTKEKAATPKVKEEKPETKNKKAANIKEEKADKKKEPKKEVMAKEKATPIKETPKKEPSKKKTAETKIANEKVDSTNEKKEPKKKKDKVFRIHNEGLESNIVVKGTIDLDAINDRTRPARKSRAQRRKERLEKEQAAKTGTAKQTKDGSTESTGTAEGGRKRRKRISRNRVNIENTGPTTRRRGRRNLRKPEKAEVSSEEVQKQIKETLARLSERRGRGSARYRRERREAASQRQREEQKQQERQSKTLQLTEFVTANDLASMMDVPVTSVIATCMNLGVMVAINQRLDAETINIVADEFGFKTKFVSAEVVEAIAEEKDKPEDLENRAPIVTVMGHVDHGKTSLLDSIRNTNVIEGEAGGITQHIGAYNVKLADGRKITFLDTPGHEAFTAMRARGAKVTDVAIIIVAADDNVMPQTVEAINHASAAGVPIVFAINKVDKPTANPEKIKEKLAEMNYLVEDWGGKYQSQEISAKKNIGISELLEKVLLEADLLELKANPDRRASGTVVESSLDKGRGYVATVLVENGTLEQGDVLLAGTFYGRVKAMFNERNKVIEKAGPATPALVLGLNGAPQAGDTFNVMESDQEARNIATRREQLQREQSLRTQRMLTLDDIGRRIAIGNFQQLNIIVKGDVDGSVEALADSLIRLSTEEIQVNVIHKAVGQISESDVTLAAASDAIIIGFQVRPSLGARRDAEEQGVDIRLYSIIYDTIEEVRSAMEGMLSPEIKEQITANVEVLEVFKISRVGTVAGAIVRDGKIKRSNNIRLVRDGIVIFTGELDSLKRFKDDAREVSSGYECGLSIKNFNDIKVGDIIEAFEEVEEKRTL